MENHYIVVLAMVVFKLLLVVNCYSQFKRTFGSSCQYNEGKSNLYQLMPSVESGEMMKNTKNIPYNKGINGFFMGEDAGKSSMVSMLNGSH